MTEFTNHHTTELISEGTTCVICNERRYLIWGSIVLFMVSFFPRIVLYTNPDVVKDDCYWDLALSLKEDYSYVIRTQTPETLNDRRKAFYFDNVTTGHRVPATPLFLAATISLFGESTETIQMIHAILTSAVSIVIFFTLDNLGKPKAGFLAGLIWSFWPLSLFYGSYISFMSEPIALYCMSFLLYASTLKNPPKKLAMLTGFVIGTSILNRSEYLIFTVLYMTLLAIQSLQWRKEIPIMIFITTCTVSPWLIRNWVYFGKPTMTTLSGYALWLGNNPWTKGTFDTHDSLDDPQMLFVKSQFPDLWQVDELTRSNYFKKATRHYLVDVAFSHPARLITLYGGKLIYFMTMPVFLFDSWRQLNFTGRAIETIIIASTALFKFLFVYFLITKGVAKEQTFFVLAAFVILAVSLMVFPGLRYEYPFDIAIIMFVSIHAEALLQPAIAKLKNKW